MVDQEPVNSGQENPLEFGVVKREGTFLSEGLALKYSLFTPDKEPTQGTGIILTLHGAATAGGRGRVLFESLQTRLAKEGYSSFTFDTRGVGESEGQFVDSTLEKRVVDAQSSLDFLTQNEPALSENVIIIGLSMGGHIAVRLAGNTPERFKALALVNPAAYAVEAEDKKLAPTTQFSDVIRRENSWRSSRAFEDIKNFRGQILFADSEFDDVIPGGLKQEYYKATTSRELMRHMQIVELRGIKHAFFTLDNPEAIAAREFLYEELVAFAWRNLTRDNPEK